MAKANISTRFEYLEPGDFFYFSGVRFLKIQPLVFPLNAPNNAVATSSGILRRFEPDVAVLASHSKENNIRQETIALIERAHARFNAFVFAIRLHQRSERESEQHLLNSLAPKSREHRLNLDNMSEMCRELSVSLVNWLEQNAQYQLDAKKNEYHYFAKPEAELDCSPHS